MAAYDDLSSAASLAGAATADDDNNNMTIDEGNGGEGEDGPIIFTVINNRGIVETRFKVNKTTKMKKVFNAYAKKHGIHFLASPGFHFKFHEKHIQPNDTAASLGLKDDDTIQCVNTITINTTTTSSKFKELQLYTNFTTCSHCNLPPYNNNKKLLTCSDCASAAYHNSACQRSHWKVHKRSCAKLSQSLLPLKELIRWNKLFKVMKQQQHQYHDVSSGGGTKRKKKKRSLTWCWWHPDNENGITSQTLQHTNHIWNVAVEQWNTKDYLRAMEGMQFALEAYQSAWPYIGKGSGSFEMPSDDVDDGRRREGGGGGEQMKNDALGGGNDHNEMEIEEEGDDFFETSRILAKRLLFLAYCELDGGQIASARQRLVQCISITNTIIYSSHKASRTKNNRSAQSILDDAYMELMLSMEEVEADKILARHVANLAIANGNCCGWVDPMQRPGYMASSTVQLSSVPICPLEQRPIWCNELERNYGRILDEYNNTSRGTPMMTNQWMDVGCGRRGSGHDDHSVVSGRGWKEYVLFGTGAIESDYDAPFTKKLLRQHVPDAVTLAQEGGGEVIFSRLSPRTHIKPHCGPTNLRWTAHLGLVIPKSKSDCRIRVGNEWKSWSAGKILLFDDSFEHEVRNDTDEERVVLLIRLWHPELTSRTVLASQLVQEAIAKKEESVQKRYNPPA